jgi:hypothetical protein
MGHHRRLAGRELPPSAAPAADAHGTHSGTATSPNRADGISRYTSGADAWHTPGSWGCATWHRQ